MEKKKKGQWGGRRPNSGKKLGAPATSPLRFDLLETLRAKGFDPVAALVEVHLDAKAAYKSRIKAGQRYGLIGFMQVAEKSAADIMEFVYPKRRAVELTGQDGQDLFQSFTDLIKNIAKEEKYVEVQGSGESGFEKSAREIHFLGNHQAERDAVPVPRTPSDESDSDS